MFPDTEHLHNITLHTKIYRKQTDQQHYLHIKCEHPKSLKDRLSHSQAIGIKRISSNLVDLNNSLKEKGYHPSLINKHLERINLLNRIDLITEKNTRKKSGRIPHTYNRFLPNITKTIRKNWNILQISKKLSKMNQ